MNRHTRGTQSLLDPPGGTKRGPKCRLAPVNAMIIRYDVVLGGQGGPSLVHVCLRMYPVKGPENAFMRAAATQQ